MVTAWILWSLLVAASFLVNVLDDRESTIEIAAAEGRASFNKDLIYRRWATMHGGVYVPITDTTPPNPYLRVPNRDVTTTSGLRLTLMNPAYMTRQVFELWPNEFGTQSHIAGLHPINPGNTPDSWEAQAIHRFLEGEAEVHEIATVDGHRLMRLMRPFRMEAACQKCHDEPIGALRGGIGTSISMQFYDELYIDHAIRTFLFHLAIWTTGFLGIFFTGQALRRQVDTWARAGEKVQRSEAELRQAVDALAQSEFRHRIVSENVSDMITEFDPAGTILFANDRHKDLLGYDLGELVGRDSVQLIHPEDRERALGLVQKVIDQPGHREHLFMRLLKRDGSSLWVECSGICAARPGEEPRVFVTSRDITEERRQQEALLVSSRLAAIGSLAAGVAHEFNNLLTIQKNNAMLILLERDRYALSPDAVRSLQYIVDSVDRGAVIVKSLGGIAMPKTPARSSFDIIVLLEHLLRVQELSIDSGRIRVETRWAEPGVTVFADRGQVEQVLINVIQNAVHAIIAKNGGLLTLDVRRTERDVRVEIADTGIGMDAGTKAHIFDPFFTTKGSHAQDSLGIPGTGLGLSISQKLVTENGGQIEVQSEEGRGTSVIIHLPGAVGTEPLPPAAPGEESPHSEGHNEILVMVVEDDQAQRESLLPLLAHLGFSSTVAFGRGPEALASAASHPPAIAIVDYIMPTMNGRDVIRELRRINPGTRCVMISGNVDLKFEDAEAPDAVLQKPIDLGELSTCLAVLKKSILGK